MKRKCIHCGAGQFSMRVWKNPCKKRIINGIVLQKHEFEPIDMNNKEENKIGGEAESWLERLKYLCFYSDGEDGLNLTGIQLKAVINFISQEIKQAEERGRNYLATHPEYHDELKLARQEGKKEAVEDLENQINYYPSIRELKNFITNYKKEKDL